MKKTAIILGATGLTGSNLLTKLIHDNRYDNIKLFSRSKIDGLPKRVTQYLGDLLKLEDFKAEFTADEVFCCIGTTAKKTPDKNLYKKIDHGIPLAAAKLAKENKINTFLVVSAMGANKKSSVFYNKTKGEMENDVLLENIEKTIILRPSIIGGERKERRILEQIGLSIFKIIQPFFIGKLKQYKIIKGDSIAKAMIYLANNNYNGETIIKSNQIEKISNI